MYDQEQTTVRNDTCLESLLFLIMFSHEIFYLLRDELHRMISQTGQNAYGS